MRRRVPRTRTPPTVPWGTNLVHAGATRRRAPCPGVVIGLTLRAWLPTAGGGSNLFSASWGNCGVRPGGGIGRQNFLAGWGVAGLPVESRARDPGILGLFLKADTC